MREKKELNRRKTNYMQQKKPPTLFRIEGFGKTATTYSPTVTQYHRRDWA